MTNIYTNLYDACKQAIIEKTTYGDKVEISITEVNYDGTHFFKLVVIKLD